MIGSLDELRAALAAALDEARRDLDPARLVHDALPPRPPKHARVIVVGAGKAAAAMTAGVFARWPDRVGRALVVTVDPLPDAHAIGPRDRVDLRAASHPVPDARSVAAAEEALRLAGMLGTSDLLLALISGGASALLAAPPDGVSLSAKQTLVAHLLDRGIGIRDVNLVRRHFSRVKGGRLAHAANGARVLTLIVSDVIDGAPHDIGSGPTVPDPTTIADAIAVLDRAGMAARASLRESVKDGDVRARAQILAEPATLAHAVARALERRGLRVFTDAPDEGDARDVVDRRIGRASAIAPGEAAVIACEPTLALPAARGRGGRAGWVALAAMRRLPDDVALLCGASDGVDGSSGAAGALVTREAASAIDPSAIDAAIEGFDDATAHAAMGTHLPGGPTGHNLADVHVLARLPRS